MGKVGDVMDGSPARYAAMREQVARYYVPMGSGRGVRQAETGAA
jgi:hypothetical protein